MVIHCWIFTLLWDSTGQDVENLRHLPKLQSPEEKCAPFCEYQCSLYENLMTYYMTFPFFVGIYKRLEFDVNCSSCCWNWNSSSHNWNSNFIYYRINHNGNWWWEPNWDFSMSMLSLDDDLKCYTCTLYPFHRRKLMESVWNTMYWCVIKLPL